MPGNINLSGPFRIKLSDHKEVPIPDGWHQVIVERAEAKLTSRKKLPQIFILSRITDESDPDYNQVVMWNLILEGDVSLRISTRFFEAAGLPEELDYPTYQALADDLIGIEIEAKVSSKTNNDGEVQKNVNRWRPVQYEDLDLS